MAYDGTAEYGTFNTQRYALKAEGDDGEANYVVDASHFQTDGYRDHSNAERDIFNAKLRLALGDDAKLTLVANAVETPFVQDPLGLTRAQLEDDPRQAGTGAILFNTRKSLTKNRSGRYSTTSSPPMTSYRPWSMQAIARRLNFRPSR